MSGGNLRSALVVGGDDGSDQPGAAARGPSATPVYELARLLRDRSVGRFEVSLMVEPSGPQLGQELLRFLADRAPQDLVVVHLAGRIVSGDGGPELLCGPGAVGGAGRSSAGLPMARLEQELRRCRSQHVVLLLDCPPAGPPVPAGPAATPAGPWPERLGGPGRSVYQVSTATVIDALGRRGSGQDPVADALAGALLVPVTASADPGTPRRAGRPWAVVAAAMPMTALGLLGLGGAAGEAVSAGAAAVIVWTVAPAATRAWRALPPDDAVPGHGVPFHRLYMLRRSQKSKDYFRHH
jgi:hypothetical protein